jgi:hypothetical protein
MAHHVILTTVYTTAFLTDIAGILFAAKDVFRMVQHSPGLYDAVQPQGWKAARGPILIGIGAALGAAGNIASMWL